MDNQYNPNETPEKRAFSMQLDPAMFEKATDEEKQQQEAMSESTTFFRDGMRRLRKNKLSMFGIIVLFAILIGITAAPHVVPYGYEEILSVEGKREQGAKNLKPFEYSKMEKQYIAKGGERFPHIFDTD